MKNKKQYECRNTLYFKAKDHSGDDIVLVKEYIHHPDGTIKPNLRIIENYQKPIYLHKPAFRTYQQKRVWRPLDEMEVFYSNEARLDDKLKQILGIPLGRFMRRKEICRNPYIYGTDIPPTALVKNDYAKRWPDALSKPTFAVLDIETDVRSDNKNIVAITLSFKDKAIIATTKHFIGTIVNPEEKFFKKLDELTPIVRKERNVNVEFVIAPTPATAVIEIFKRAHEWQPDFICGWNLMGFDIPVILDSLTQEGYRPEEILSDPRVPARYRECVYFKGRTVQEKSDGEKAQPLSGYEQWHWLSCPASFYFIDSMCLYFQVRKGKPLEENYKLDTIMKKHLNLGKIEIDEVKDIEGIDRHLIMQSKYKIEYLVYNLFDCVGLELLEEKIRDVTDTMPALAGVTHLSKYTSNPTKLVEALHFFAQEHPEIKGVLGTVSDELRSQLDKYVTSRSGWIVTLPSERLLDVGLKILKEFPDVRTKIRGQSGDIDVTAGYPNIEIGMNMSKDTTVHEIYKIEGLEEEERRVVGLNILGGKVNTINIARTLYGLPKPEEMYQAFLNQQCNS